MALQDIDVESLYGGEPFYDMSLETALKLVGFCDTDIGQFILKHLDREEYGKFEEDVQELRFPRTLYNKGYIAGIRAVRALFQHAYKVELEERERLEEQKGNDDGSNQ